MARWQGYSRDTSYRATVGPGVALANPDEALLSPATPLDDTAIQAFVDSGDVLGATDDGLEFSAEPEYQTWAFAGIGENIRGGHRLLNVEATISGSFTEIYGDNMKKFVPYADIEAWQTTEATPTVLGEIVVPRPFLVDADYLDSLAIVAERQGTSVPVVIMIYNGFNQEGFSLSLEGDENRSATDVTFIASYGEQTFDPATGRFDVPWKIYLPTPATPVVTP